MVKIMKECLRCKKELIEDLDVYAQGVYEFEVSSRPSISESPTVSTSTSKLWLYIEYKVHL